MNGAAGESNTRRELRESGERLREVIDNAPVGITELDLDGRILEANPQACALLGYPREELVGRRAGDLVAPGQGQERSAALQALVDDARQDTRYEVTFRRKDGVDREAEVFATVLRDETGAPRSILALMQDVTDRRALEARVRAQAELINHAHDAMFVRQLGDGTITFWNPAAERLYGFSRDEAVGRAAHDLLRTQFPLPVEEIERQVGQTGDWSGELVHLAKSGEPVWVESRWALIHDERGEPVAALEANRDVTAERHLGSERERLTTILEEQNRELRQKDRLKTEFLLTISHELRTPLTAILGFSDLLAMDSPLAERTELDIIQRNGRRLLSIIEDILVLAQFQAGDLKLRPRPVNIAGVVRRVAETERALAREKGLSFETEGDRTPAWVIADETATGSVVRHLVGNAIKFTNAGGIKVRVRRSGDRVRVEVEDTGIGVPPDARQWIFEDFRQVDQSVTRRYGGAGIGLTVVRDLLSLQDGKLGLEDRPGGGSLFWFSLPAEVPEEGAGE